MVLNMFTAKKTNVYKLPFEPFGYGDSERAIEIPWTLSCVKKTDKRVLDVGYAFAEDRYISSLVNLGIPELHGVDLVLEEGKGFGIIKSQGDLRDLKCYEDDYFDLILAVSVIEHVGFNNDGFFEEKDYVKDFNADKIAIKNLIKVLKPGGRLAITVPYGKKVDYDWFIQYNKRHLNRLTKLSGVELLSKDIFIYKEDGWYEASERELKKIEYRSQGACNAAGLACVVLEKKKNFPFLRSKK